MDKLWKVKESAPEDFFSSNSKYSKTVLQLLWNRGIRTPKEIEEFFNISLDNLIDPKVMLNMLKGANQIISGIKNNERMALFGDYDTDGICSVVILAKFFNKIGFENFDVFIPNRFKGGYGLNLEKIKKMSEDGVKLIITVDCGITDVEEVELARSLGMEVLIFDHHLPHEELPQTLIVDPNQEGDSYPFKSLVATAIAYKLFQTLADLMNFPYKNSLENQFLPLVAIASIADVASMVGENRVLVKFGLEKLGQIQNIGLRSLMEIANIADLKKYTSYHIGFVIAPRLNAVGRVEHLTPSGRFEDTDYSFELLMTENENEAKVWAQKIHEFNIERQRQVEQIINDVNKEIEKQNEPDRVIFFGGPNWSKGMIGVVAGKLKDKWNRPVFLYAQGEKTSQGSSRSIPSYNLVEVLDKHKDLLLESGGHKLAAGFEVANENLEKLKQALKQEADILLSGDKDLIPSVEIDACLTPDNLNEDFLNWWRKFEPFGRDNEEPIFKMEQVSIVSSRIVGSNGKHIKFSVQKNNRVFNIISFNNAEKLSFLQPGMLVDIVFYIRENEWQGRTYLEFELVDIKKV